MILGKTKLLQILNKIVRRVSVILSGSEESQLAEVVGDFQSPPSGFQSVQACPEINSG